jgi:type IV pilus assembly protein PilA
MAIRKRLKEGFTLIELMIVVAIVGVLAVLAVYGVRKYIANAKTAEAKNSLGQMGKDAVTAFEGERMKAAILAPGGQAAVTRKICPSSSAPVPAGGLPLVKGGKYQSKGPEWSPAADVLNVDGFPCLKFEMTAPQYYVYNYTSDSVSGNPNSQGTQFSATAQGDLNGDAVASTFTLLGQVSTAADGARLLVSPTIAELSPEE